MKYIDYIEENTLRCEASYRGGGIEIDLAELFPGQEDPRMSAYQNYLGGGMLSSVQANANFEPEEDEKEVYFEIAEELKQYFHNITNPSHDEWSESDFETNQSRPASAY